VGIAVTDDFEVFFDTAEATRKVENLRRDPRIALVIGGTALGDERRVQYEGIVDEPAGADLQRLKDLYFEAFLEGRGCQGWPGITYIRARRSGSATATSISNRQRSSSSTLRSPVAARTERPVQEGLVDLGAGVPSAASSR
jgi:hypothetical protein